MPVVLRFGEEMTVDKMVKNQVACHKSCYVKFSKQKLERALKKRNREATSDCSYVTQKRPRRQAMEKSACLFCQKEEGKLHEVRTLGADATIRQMARELKEQDLMARIEGGDLVALEAKYHPECYTSFRNRHRGLLRSRNLEVLLRKMK